MSRLSLLGVMCALLFGLFSTSILAAESPRATSEQVSQLDINKADANAIASALDGIGMVKAEEIVAYREAFGNFRSVDELLAVPGIGEVTLEKNRHRIVITTD